jgi:hypothetical protein
MSTAKQLREATEKTVHAPPRIVELPPSAFASTWDHRPNGPMQVGLRRISADELLAADIKGKARAHEIFPALSPFDPYRLEVAEIVRFHVILGKALCDPKDVRKPLWRDQQELASDNMLSRGPTGSVEPMRFTRDGLGRLFDELEVLNIEGNPTWPEATDDELEELANSILDGSFIEDLESVVDPGATEEDFAQMRSEFEGDIRRFAKHIIELRRNGPKTMMGSAALTES